MIDARSAVVTALMTNSDGISASDLVRVVRAERLGKFTIVQVRYALAALRVAGKVVKRGGKWFLQEVSW